MKFNTKYIKLFSCCIPIKGASRSSLCDVQRNVVKLIPNALYKLIPFFDSQNIDDIICRYGAEHSETVKEYIDFLIENDFAFYCSKDELECFPPINISEFHIPFHISNAIIELDGIDKEKILHIIDELNSVECPALEIRVQTIIEISEIETMLSLFNNPKVNVTELHVIIIDNEFTLEKLKPLFERHMRLTSLVIGGAPENKRHTDFFFGNSQIIFTTRNVHLPTCCGNFAPEQFVINLPFFTESQHYNTCLNRKVAIDKDGNIKNCPSMSRSFGNISNTKVVDIIENKEFTAKWNINKDQISICQDCEFRHVCMDCRAYLEDPDDDYSKPLKCGYNPYTMEWEDWSQNPLKKLTMKHYNLKDL